MGFPIAAEIADVAFIASSYSSLPLQTFSTVFFYKVYSFSKKKNIKRCKEIHT
jgi:hypothetical protein